MTRSRRRAKDRDGFEIAVLAVAALAIAIVVGTLLVTGVQNSRSAADLRVRVEPSGPASGGGTYLVTVRNEGGRTAEHVVVEVAVGAELREIQFPAVARNDEESATAVFPPGTAGPGTARVLSYTDSTR